MTSCDFAEFYNECRDRLTDIQLRELDSDAEYYKLKQGYCGLRFDDVGVWISIFVGGMEDAWELRRIIAEAPRVGFLCRVGSPTYAIARYYKAKIEDSGEKYLDQAPAMRCVIDTRQTRRLQKNREKVKATS